LLETATAPLPPISVEALLKINCTMTFPMPMMQYAIGLSQHKALKNKEIKPTALCRGMPPP